MAEVYKVGWQQLYGATIQTTSISTAGSFATGLGLSTGNRGLLLTSRPDLNPGQSFSTTKKTHGLSYKKVKDGYDSIPTIQLPTVTLEMDAHAYNLAFFSWLLFQKGSTQSTSTYTFRPPTATEGPACEAWATIIRDLGQTGSVHGIHGCICRSMTISSTQGEVVKLSVELVGHSFVSNLATVALTYSEKVPLLHQNINAKLGASGTAYADSTAIGLDSFSVTMTNNAITRHYNYQYPNRHLLGDFTATGSFSFPWGNDVVGQNAHLTKYIAGDTGILYIAYGGSAVPSVDGQACWSGEVNYTGPPTVASDGELVNSFPFEVAMGDSGTISEQLVTFTTTNNLGIPA